MFWCDSTSLVFVCTLTCANFQGHWSRLTEKILSALYLLNRLPDFDQTITDLKLYK